ncbi:DinB family protein [Pedobacter sp. SYSU D00535]|uniref:DinB family protein n=1 Tax=Pedobacter sp. SYSU D00535 TaxID=2810308 RepID=UPI001A979A5C|nr:DinB family protein [Pedobacter sp. SYSU D00535]
MNMYIDVIENARKSFLKLIEGLSIESLNTVPPNFNNNIAWHLGHLVASQQVLCYKLGNEPLIVPAEIVGRYGRGTKPEATVTEEEIQELKAYLTATIEQLRADLKSGLFSNYTAYTTSSGVALNNIDDALKYVCMHEGLHLGYVMAQKRFLM